MVSQMRLYDQHVMSVAQQADIAHMDDIETAIVQRNGAIRILKLPEKPES